MDARTSLLAVAAVAASLSASIAAAQPTAGTTRYDPWYGVGYVGGSIADTEFDRGCFANTNCDDGRAGFKLFAGNRFHRYMGLELAVVKPGKAEYGGGETRATGINLSFVGYLPLYEQAALFAKAGGTYGWTKVTGTAPGFSTGKEDGFQPSFGVGAMFQLTPNLGIRAEWEQYRFEFINDDDNVRLLSVGLQYQFR